jgi:hypothetical protein
MIAALGVISVAVGTAFAYTAGQNPQHQQFMQTFGGVLLIAGFALLGCALGSVFGRFPC